TVTFTVEQGATVIGTATTSATVSGGLASVNYALPAGLAAGSYTIHAVYNPGSDFTGSEDATHSLTVGAASTTIAASAATATFSTSNQDVTLTAEVSSGTNSVDEGTVTFTIEQGATVIGTATTSATVNGGLASVSYALPASLPSGSYTIDAVYNPGSDFTGSEDTTHSLTVGAATTTTTAGSATATFSESTRSLTLSAHVTSSVGLVNEGSVTFTILQNRTVLGTATSGTVSNGQASVIYALPASVLPGSYTIEADYADPASNFAASGGTAYLKMSAADATVVQLSTFTVVPNLLNGTAQVTLTAQVSNPAGSVNEGSVTFTFAGHSAQATVRNGTASVQLTVPLLSVMVNQTVSLAYASSGGFGPGAATVGVSLNMWSVLSSAEATLTADGEELYTIPFFQAPLEFFYTNQQLTEFRYGPLDLQFGYVNIGGQVVETINGVPWQVTLLGPQGQFLGTVSLASSANG
ncbi:MAG: Ig-like domain-containing protein, partial [Gemmataceae bacterium]